jgi:hypothetical protein
MQWNFMVMAAAQTLQYWRRRGDEWC